MAFRKKKDRPIYTAKVHYYGDVDAMEIEPEDLNIRAWVEAPEPPQIAPDRNALTALVPLLAPVHLFMNASAASGALYPAVELLRGAAAELLKGEDAARSYAIEGKRMRVGGAPEGWLTPEVEIPRPVGEPEGPSNRVQEFTLLQRRSGEVWARSRAPGAGQALFANAGLVHLIQHVAHECDYEQTIVPMAAGLGAFVGQFDAFEEQGREDGDEMSEASWAGLGPGILTLGWQESIAAVVFSDNPPQTLAELSAS